MIKTFSKAFFVKAGRKGGEATKAKHPDHLSTIARKKRKRKAKTASNASKEK